jgi:hypothetical protein
MKTLKSILTATFAVLALSSAAFALPPGKGGPEITTKAQFAELKGGDKVTLVCKMCDSHTVVDIKDTASAMKLCEEGSKIHCPTCKKDYKVTWGNPKSGGPTTTMTIVDENGKPCMAYIKAS